MITSYERRLNAENQGMWEMQQDMVRFNAFIFLFFLVSNIFAIDKDIMNLENIYNEIVSHKYLWEETLNRYYIVDYEDILRMERREIFIETLGEIAIIYNCKNLVFSENGAIRGEYFFIVSINFGTVFTVVLKHINGNFVYQRHHLRFISH